MADIIDALGTVFVGMPNSRARRTRSVWVVALEELISIAICIKAIPIIIHVPEWITDNKECYIRFVGSLENLIAPTLDQLSVGYNDRASIESFLLMNQDIL